MQIQSLNLFLEDGDPFGRIKCTIPYWTGTAYKIPRDKFEPHTDYKLCFFFSDKPSVQIGTGAEDWTDAVIFVDKSLGSTEINFLEHKFYELARAANRCEITSAKTFTRPNLSAEKKSELEIFAEYVRIIVGIFGYKIFEPATEIPVPPAEIPAEEPIFYLSRKMKSGSTISASGKKIANGILVMTGSQISPIAAKYISENVKKARKRAKISAENILKEDVFFDTPSGAAAFVLGISANGWVEWKTRDGVPLKDFR